MHTYLFEHDGEFPRSFHSAGAHGQPGWSASLAPYLGIPETNDPAEWARHFNKHFRCPEHRETNPAIFSYALNVYFELNPNGDSYAGSPNSWRRLNNIGEPSRTIMVAETRPVFFGDHIMSHLWGSRIAAQNALAERHSGRLSFLFVDGSVKRLSAEDTFNKQNNLWHPLNLGREK